MALDQDWKDQFDYYYKTVNADNKESAKTQMDFQERMSSSSHQREVKDLIAAGLNPVLSANNGASTPMGSYANVDSSAVSAKFARQNLEKELKNARTLQSMANENAWNIAMQQLSNNKEIAAMNNKTQRFNTIVEEYGVFAALAYGLAEGLYEDPSIQGLATNVINSKDDLLNAWNMLNSTQNSIDKGISSADDGLAIIDRLLGNVDSMKQDVKSVSPNISNKSVSAKSAYSKKAQWHTQNLIKNIAKKVAKKQNFLNRNRRIPKYQSYK